MFFKLIMYLILSLFPWYDVDMNVHNIYFIWQIYKRREITSDWRILLYLQLEQILVIALLYLYTKFGLHTFLRTNLFLGRTKVCQTTYSIHMIRLDGNCCSLLPFVSMNQCTLEGTAYVSEIESPLHDNLCKTGCLSCEIYSVDSSKTAPQVFQLCWKLLVEFLCCS